MATPSTPAHGDATSGDGFDYIVVGSGAGGAPLAARLAESGLRVLVIEAGPDHLETAAARDVSLVPSFHGLSTERPEMSWEFFVEHYDQPPAGPDPKRHTPQPGEPPSRDGIFYPRSSGIGGCTVHNAMITIAGPDGDWDDLADAVQDDSWRAGPMRAYFQRLERNEYSPRPSPPPTGWWGRARDLLKWLFGFDPDHTSGRHGFDGWLHTSLTDLRLGLHDKQLLRMLKAALIQARRAGIDRASTFVRRFLKGRIFQGLDPNHSRTQAESPEGVVTVPLAVCGARTTIHQNPETPFVMTGRRSSPREFLLGTRARHPAHLVIWTDALVTRVLFDEGPEPRAVGVEVLKGARLYGAHKRAEDEPAPQPGAPERVFVRGDGEVVLCGGAFNTPQLLMLSGIGDAGELSAAAAGGGDPARCTLTGRDGRPLGGGGGHRIHRPGVGRNLQDRYEVTLITEMKRDFPLLDGATFVLPDGTTPDDRHLKEWRAEGTGLYTSNGSVLGIFRRSHPDADQPDLFIFGLPFPFEGYQLGYSEVGAIHNTFTWAILKGHTRNCDGRVRLRSTSPLDPPRINFHYFNEVSRPGQSALDPDVQALVEGVKFVRAIGTHRIGLPTGILREQHPGLERVPNDDDAISQWIRREAWGHHACGTCRMGVDGDPGAVLDSRFRVRGVAGLRVVDASIFPRIPGYFIVTNIYMASEKAADVIREDRAHGRVDEPTYPRDLREREAAAVEERRRRVFDPAPPARPAAAAASWWADDVTGLALSGGGIRSATLALGVLQAFARHRWLRKVDLLSTVSGGGYIGSFLGRWFDRLRTDRDWSHGPDTPVAAADHIEQGLNDPRSPIVGWLRRQGNYLSPTGEGDERLNAAVFVRNFLSVHFVMTLFIFVLFGLANLVRYGGLSPVAAAVGLAWMDAADLPLGRLLKALLGPFYSPWFFVFELAILLMVVPRIVGYWIVSQERHGRFSFVPLLLMMVVSGALLFAGVYDGLDPPLVAMGLAPYASLVSVELAWRRGRIREDAIGRGSVETQRLRTRNYLTYDLGIALVVAGGALWFAIVDTAAHALHQAALDNQVYVQAIAGLIAGVAALAPVVRLAANLFAREKSTTSSVGRLVREHVAAGLLALVLLIVPMIFVSFLAHAAFGGGTNVRVGGVITLFALVVSVFLALPQALVFVNRSSLAQTYAARLARAYLGASNPKRHRPEGEDVTEVVAGDDVASIRDYQPHKTGGPFHLLNVTVNQTVDFTSQRGNRDRKGDNLAVSAVGVSVGRQFHSAWADRPGETELRGRRKKVPARLEPLGHVPGTPHPLVDETGRPASRVEMLSLRQWMAISGAAVGPGRGQTTKLGTALLFGLANLRTGYWWDSGIPEAARDGYPPLTALQRLLYIVQSFFLTQTLLLFEWLARFPGPWERFWFISDGGFFENLGGYELIRRRVPRIIICDGSADPNYDMEGMAELMRRVRLDFNAWIEPFEPADYDAAGVPEGVRARLGSLDDLRPRRDEAGAIVGPSTRHAALFRVRYPDAPGQSSVLLYIKATLTGDESIDVRYRHTRCPDFPHEGTVDQVFDEAQWESYRALGDHMAGPLAAAGDWFWRLRLR